MLIYHSKKLLITKYKNFIKNRKKETKRENKNVKNDFNYIKYAKIFV